MPGRSGEGPSIVRENLAITLYMAERASYSSLRLTDHVYPYWTLSHVHTGQVYSHILGVKPLDTGFRKVRIRPFPGDLKWAKGHFYTPQGDVRVSWQAEGGTFTMDVELPENCEYGAELPADKFAGCRLKVNGVLLS